MSEHNIVVVMCDQMRRGAMGCSGNPDVSTPHLDRLANGGVRFENACSTYPVCVPTRFTLLTGKPAHSRFVPSIDYRLSPTERTLADEFGDAGYRTVYTGKWHLGGMHRYEYSDDDVDTGKLHNRTPVPPEYQGGFDHWQGFELRNDPFDTVYFENDDPTPREIPGYQTDGLFDLALEEITNGSDDPFFHVISVEPPHPPLVAPEANERRIAERDLDFRPNVSDPSGDLMSSLRTYYAMIENLDDNVGRLVETLEREGIREDTVLVFLSDHGELLGSHGLRGKNYPYEESIGVPFIVSGPGIDGGHAVSEPICTEDWYPTLCGLAGIDGQTGAGIDLTPVVRSESGSPDRPGVALEYVAEFRPHKPFAGDPWRGFRTERYKYTVKGGATGAEPWQLFDLYEDPYEQNNVIGEDGYVDVARTLHGHLRAHLQRSSDDYRLAPAYGYDGLGLPDDMDLV